MYDIVDKHVETTVSMAQKEMGGSFKIMNWTSLPKQDERGFNRFVTGFIH